MFPVIDVIAAAFHPSQSKSLVIRRPWSGHGRRMGLTGTAEKPLFNIGRIPARQSHSPVLPAASGKSCRRAGKSDAAATG
jgi:hypothetical protein